MLRCMNDSILQQKHFYTLNFFLGLLGMRVLHSDVTFIKTQQVMFGRNISSHSEGINCIQLNSHSSNHSIHALRAYFGTESTRE